MDQNGNSNQVKAKPKHAWSNLTYTTRVTIAFALIALMTAAVALGVISFVWAQHFQTYTYENMKSVARTTANQIATRYETNGTFSRDTLDPARYTINMTPGIGLQVVDNSGSIVFDSTVPVVDGANGPVSNSENNEDSLPQLSETADPEKMATADITVGGENIGQVRVWVYGSDSLLRATDIQFRDNSYQALLIAAGIAVVLASCLGYFFARSLVRPIKTMTETAEAIKEGDLSARTDMHGEDEIGQLAETFDAMASAVERDQKLERRLTTDVAHELRTPLMAIQSTVEAMVDGVFEPDEEHLTTVNAEVKRLSRLVNSLLRLSRLENRSTPLKEEVVDLGELIQGIITTHAAFVADSGLSLDYTAEKDVRVLCDPDMIRQATANLISNSVRYTPEGGHILVSVKKGDIMASIAVSDTGIGLTPEEARMVFQRFWRADAGRTRESGGLGIGLAVVKEIVSRHGGWVQVEGRKGEGSCFTIHLPLYNEKTTQSLNQPYRPRSTRNQSRNNR
ncbi:MAG: sensor histidine kinase [Eggerthellaceae bacterium]